jgi:HK97 family phage prohead protease
LRITARFASTPKAQEVRTLLLEGHLSRMSIGYETVTDEWAERDGKRVRLITAAELWEVSVVVFPANNEAVVTGPRAAQPRATMLNST